MRRTVAKVATLEQASKIGGVSLQGMILKLRAAAGLEAIDVPVVETPQPGEQRPSTPNGSRVVEEVDADVMLERGIHPIGRIRELVARLGPGESVVLRSSFRPEPLIEALRRAGAEVCCSTLGTTHVTLFSKSTDV